MAWGRNRLVKRFALLLLAVTFLVSIIILVNLYGINTSELQQFPWDYSHDKETLHRFEKDAELVELEKKIEYILKLYTNNKQALDSGAYSNHLNERGHHHHETPMKVKESLRRGISKLKGLKLQHVVEKRHGGELLQRQHEEELLQRSKEKLLLKRKSTSGILNAHIWEGWCGPRVEDLKRDKHFPLYPSFKTNITLFFAQWNEAGYGERIFGYIHPPETGKYIFAVSCDDNCEIWLSNSSNPRHIEKIAYVGTLNIPANTKLANFRQYQSQISKQIHLVGGKRYYIEALHKQAAYKDHVLLTWLAPSWQRIRTISSKYISSYISNDLDGLGVDDYSMYIPETKATLGGKIYNNIGNIYYFNRTKYKFGSCDNNLLLNYSSQLVEASDFSNVLPPIDYAPSYVVSFVPKRYEGVKLIHETAVYPNDNTALTHMYSYEDCLTHRQNYPHFKELFPGNTLKTSIDEESWFSHLSFGEKFTYLSKLYNKKIKHLVHQQNIQRNYDISNKNTKIKVRNEDSIKSNTVVEVLRRRGQNSNNLLRQHIQYSNDFNRAIANGKNSNNLQRKHMQNPNPFNHTIANGKNYSSSRFAKGSFQLNKKTFVSVPVSSHTLTYKNRRILSLEGEFPQKQPTFAAASKNENQLNSINENQLNSRNENQLDSRNENHLNSRNENQLNSRNENQLNSRNENQLNSKNENQLNSRNENQLNSKNENQLNSRNENQLNSRNENQLDSRNENQLDSRNENHLNSRNENHLVKQSKKTGVDVDVDSEAHVDENDFQFSDIPTINTDTQVDNSDVEVDNSDVQVHISDGDKGNDDKGLEQTSKLNSYTQQVDDELPHNLLENSIRDNPISIPHFVKSTQIKNNAYVKLYSLNLLQRNTHKPVVTYITNRNLYAKRNQRLRRSKIHQQILHKVYFKDGTFFNSTNTTAPNHSQMAWLYNIFGSSIYHLSQVPERHFQWLYNQHLSDCKTDGNLRLSEEIAINIVNEYMKSVTEKHNTKYSLKNIVNVEENHDVIHGDRYLVEIDLQVKGKDGTQHISQYIYRPLGSKNLFQITNFQWNPYATVHIIIPVKDQGRWVLHFIKNMESIYALTKDPYLNIIIVDFNSTDIDIIKILGKSKLKRYQVVTLDGPFQRALGVQAGADAVENPNDIVFACDLHLEIPFHLIKSIRKHTIKQRMAFAPMVFRLSCGYTPELPFGLWEIQGYGLFAISKYDFERIGGMNTKEFKTKWGGEDWEFLDRTLEFGLEVERMRIPDFYHYYHSKKRMWIAPKTTLPPMVNVDAL